MKARLEQRIQKAADLGVLDEDTRAGIIARLHAMPLQNQLCHGDFHVQNLIQTTQGLRIIDWVDATSGTPESDICRSYLLYRLYYPDAADLYLDLYCTKKNLDREAILAWLPIVAAAKFVESTNDKRITHALNRLLER
jgi:thiamine kinase-like enzyme